MHSSVNHDYYKPEVLTNRKICNNQILLHQINKKNKTEKINIVHLNQKNKKKSHHKKNKSRLPPFSQQQFQSILFQSSNSHSQIIFSNSQTKRQSIISNHHQQNTSIYHNQPDLNFKLRINIRKQYQKKVQAAIKIQKIYRGYRIRKLIDQIISNTQYHIKSINYKNLCKQQHSIKQNDTHRTFVDQQAQIFMNKLFQNKVMNDIHFNHTMKPRVQDFSSSDNNQDHQIHNFSKYQQNNTYTKQYNNYVQSQQYSSKSLQPNNFITFATPNQVLPQQQLIHCFNFQSEQSKSQSIHQIYEPCIMFQTNQEYRKNSSQNKKNNGNNKINNKELEKIIQKNGEKNKRMSEKNEKKFEENNINIYTKQEDLKLSKQKNLQKIQQNNTIHAKKIQKIQNNSEQQLKSLPKQKSIPITQIQNKTQPILEHPQQKTSQKQQSDFPTSKNPQAINLQITVKQDKKPKPAHQKIKSSISPRYTVKYLQQQIYSYINLKNQPYSQNINKLNNTALNKKQLQHQQILKLRQQQSSKWQQMIRMVNQQIKKNQHNNGEIVNFMKNIMDFSQKNKQLLANTKSITNDNFNTPSLPILQEDQLHKQDKLLFVKPQTQINQQLQYKFFKKKPITLSATHINQLQPKKQPTLITQQNQNQKQQQIKQQIKQKQQQQKNPLNEHKKYKKLKTNNLKKQQFFIHNIQFQKPIIKQQSSNKYKKYLSSNIQLQDSSLNNILKLRQQLLSKRQSIELLKLNKQLTNKSLNQQQFIEKLEQLQKKYEKQKKIIDKSKYDIIKGYQAANDIVKQYFCNAKKLGIKLPVSKSQDHLKFKFLQTSPFIHQVQIDQLSPKLISKSNIGNKLSQEIQEEKSKDKSSSNAHLFSSSQDSSIDFTEEQLKKLRKTANYDLQFNDLNRNMTTISDQFIRQQKKCFNDDVEILNSLNQSPQNSIFNFSIRKQMYHLQQQKIPLSRAPPHIQSTIQDITNMIIIQFSCELLLQQSISDHLIQKITTKIKPQLITNKQRIDFLNILSQNLQQKQQLNNKINQNILPTPLQILKYMRLTFEQNEYEQQYNNIQQQKNKYQFVISQQSCTNTIIKYKQINDLYRSNKYQQNVKKSYSIFQMFYQAIQHTPIAETIKNFIQSRQKSIYYHQKQCQELKWEYMKTQFHCIFDCWNEQIIEYCSHRPGFSGIGLNELSLSIINNNKLIQQNEVQQLLKKTKNNIIQIILDENTLHQKILNEIFHELCQIDSIWILYADDALNYALEFVYLIQQDLYAEIARQLRKIFIKNSFTL